MPISPSYIGLEKKYGDFLWDCPIYPNSIEIENSYPTIFIKNIAGAIYFNKTARYTYK